MFFILIKVRTTIKREATINTLGYFMFEKAYKARVHYQEGKLKKDFTIIHILFKYVVQKVGKETRMNTMKNNKFYITGL